MDDKERQIRLAERQSIVDSIALLVSKRSGGVVTEAIKEVGRLIAQRKL